MKTRRSILAMVLTLLLCTSLALNASAATRSVPAGIYIVLTGTVSTASGNLVPTTTSVNTNPDSAILYITAQFSDGVNDYNSFSSESSRGVKSFSSSLPIYSDGVGSTPTQVYTAHGVKKGSQAPNGYVCYMLNSI